MKTTYVNTNFTGGEQSPKIRGRVDIAQYQAGARQLRNAIPLVTGGALSRPGTTFVAAAKSGASRCRLIPFVIKGGQNYVLELGDFYFRVFKDGAAIGAPLEVATPWTTSQLMDIDYAQDAATMYFAHEAYPIHRIQRFADDFWSASAVPFTTTPYAEIGRRSATTGTLSNATVGSGRTCTTSGAAFLAADVGRAILYRGGSFVLTAYTSTTLVTGDVTLAFGSVTLPVNQWILEGSPQTTCTASAATPVGATITLTLGAAGWRSTDVGSHVIINGGICRISAFTSDTVVSAVIVTELASTTAAPALAWSLKAPQWNTLDGYPRTVTLHQQRLVAAGSPSFPQTIWGSRVGEPTDFGVDVTDDAGYSFTIGSDENNQIAYVASARHLMALTYGAEYSLRGQQTKTVISTATPPEIVPESNHGAATVRPVQVKKELLFAQRAGKEIRSLNFRYDFDGYESPDLSALADHLFGKLDDGTSLSIVDMAYQQRPHSVLWVARSDGSLVSLTIDRTQGVIGWALHDVGGDVESLCCVPGSDADVLYLAVKRTVNAATVRYIERMEWSTTSTRASEKYLMQLDCAKAVYAGGGMTTVTHAALPSTEVGVLIDGTNMGDVTTNGSGVATLTRTAYSVQVGLPFTVTIEPNSPEDGSTGQVAIGQRMSTSAVTLRVLDSGPFTVNGQSIERRAFGVDVLDGPAPVLSGDVPVSELGWADGLSPMVIERTLPFPLHVLAVIRQLTVNAG